MRLLRTNTATRITIGPFMDRSDGVTPENSLTVTGCHLTLMVDVNGVPTLVLDADATASGGSNDMVHVTGDDAGFYDLELTAAQLNYLGRAMLAITNAADFCPVFHEFEILPAQVYDSLVLGTDLLDVQPEVSGIWDRATSLLTTAGSIGKRLADNVDAVISTMSPLGSGSVAWVVTVTVGGLPKDGVDVWATTDVAGTNVVARGYTNAAGQVTLMLDPGTYYFWKQLSGYAFTNPQEDVVT